MTALINSSGVLLAHPRRRTTSAAAAFYADREGFTFEKFVIPNPFGPYEESRFTAYLMRSWLNGETARVQTPRYIRDNVPVSLLARAYADFVAANPMAGSVRRFGPSFYPESQGAFAERVRREAAARLALPCALEFSEQTEFREPPVRVNTDLCEPAGLGWSETAAWDDFSVEKRRGVEVSHPPAPLEATAT